MIFTVIHFDIEMLKIIPGLNMNVIYDDAGGMKLIGEDKNEVSHSSLQFGTNKANLLLQYTELQSQEYYQSLVTQRSEEQRVHTHFFLSLSLSLSLSLTHTFSLSLFFSLMRYDYRNE
jgi:hypothetical protein